MNYAADHWEQVGHYYTPIAYYAGQVLKYEGIATKGNTWFLKDHPGSIVLDDYKGDRIWADNHDEFAVAR